MISSRSLALFLLVLAAHVSSARAQVRHVAPRPKSSAPRATEPASPSYGLPAAELAKPVMEEPAQAAPVAAPAQPSPASSSTLSAQPLAPAQAQTAPQATAKTADAASDAELAGLQQDLAQVMDDLVQARARVAVLGKSLFKTRVRVKLDNRAAPEQVAARATLWLDGAPIWNGDGPSMRGPERALFDGFAAPGAHTLTVEVEQRARKDEAYRYTLRESYRFMVVREKRTDVVLVLDDDSDMAEEFPDDQEGEYDVRTRLKVHAVGLNEE
jgi:cell wall-associated NlpC family hydrolase